MKYANGRDINPTDSIVGRHAESGKIIAGLVTACEVADAVKKTPDRLKVLSMRRNSPANGNPAQASFEAYYHFVNPADALHAEDAHAAGKNTPENNSKKGVDTEAGK